MIKIPHLFLIAATLLFFSAAHSAQAQNDVSLESLEKTFIHMLTNTTLKGSWVPVKEGAVGDKQAGS